MTAPPNISQDMELPLLLDKVYNERGWDFRNYKRTTLQRRITKRLSANNIRSCLEYIEVLDSDPSEYSRLFSCLTIKVSEFFRDPEVYEALWRAVAAVPRQGGGLRAWSCGCANGEEAYSLAILLAEVLPREAFLETKVFATDIDDSAIDSAKRAEYRKEYLENVPAALRERYFMESGRLYKVKYGIRNAVKFGLLDIVRTPPLPRIHVLFCRNLFIYFNKALQERVFEKLDYSIVPGGLLVLGKAEVIPPKFLTLYSPTGGGRCVYRKKGPS